MLLEDEIEIEWFPLFKLERRFRLTNLEGFAASNLTAMNGWMNRVAEKVRLLVEKVPLWLRVAAGTVALLFSVFFLSPSGVVIVAVIVGAVVVLGLWKMWLVTKGADVDFDASKLSLLKNKAAYLQSCFTIAAIIIGAGWAAYVWRSQRADQMAAVQVEIDAHQAHPPGTGDNEYFIEGDVSLKNAGTK